MSSKSKGSAAERELVSMLWGAGLCSVRIAGSGVSRFPCPDVLASNGSKVFAIECKSCKNKKRYISAQQIRELLEFSKAFSAEPLIAVKVANEGWFFLSPNELEKSKGGNYVINQTILNKRARRFIDISRGEKQARLIE